MNITYQRYEAYEQRMLTLLRILRWLKKHYLKIAIPVVVVTMGLVFLGTVPGIVTQPLTCPDFVYGEDAVYHAETLLSDIIYEFASETGESWSTQIPVEAGTYCVRAVTYNGFGKPRYSEAVLFTIVPAPLTLQVMDSSCIYGDIAAYTVDHVRVDGLRKSDKLYEVQFASQDVSICEMTVMAEHFTIINSDGKDVTACYSVQTLPGSLVFEQRTLVLSSADESKIYDGTPFGVSNFSITGGSLATGNCIEYIPDEQAVITETGNVDARFSVRITDTDGRDVTENYAMEYNYGTLTVLPRPVTVATRSATKSYDGVPLTAQECIVVNGSLVKGDHIVYTGDSTASVIVPGSVEAKFRAAVINEDGIDVSHLYLLTYEYGTLTVEPRPIVLTTGSMQKIYDGTSIHGASYTITEGSLVDGHTAELIYSEMPDEVGQYDNIATACIKNADGSDVTSYYAITIYYGVLQIDPRPVTFLSSGAERVYTGQPLTAKTYQIVSGTVAANQTVHPIFTASQTDIGTCNNTFTVTITDSDGKDVTANYQLTYEYGILKVTPIYLTLSTESAQKVYDGTPLTHSKWKLISGKVATGQSLTVSTTGSQTEVGESKNTATAKVYNAAGKDVTAAGYVISYELGTLKVTTRPITITSGSLAKKYDGKPLTYERYQVGSSQLAKNQSLSLHFTGSRTMPGSSENTFTAKILDSVKKDVSHNYDITYVYGTLTVVGDLDTEQTEDPQEITIGFPKGGEKGDPSLMRSGMTGTIYLRDNSYGSYTGRGWTVAPTYTVKESLNPLFFAGDTLQAYNQIATTTINIRTKNTSNSTLVPYHTANTLTTPVEASDNRVRFSALNYSVRASLKHSYTELLSLETPARISAEEAIYREFVHQNYLAVPTDTAEVLLALAEENNIRADSATLITDISRYIQGAAKYNLEGETYPSNVDQVVYFLTASKEGICQHYASAATLMYRVFGIPARYTTGYKVDVMQVNTWIELCSQYAHAWVEIYLDGYGWFPIEVTGSANGHGGGHGGDVPEPDDAEPDDAEPDESEEILIGRDASMDEVLFAQVQPSVSGEVYLRALSYGDYTGRGWKTATPYNVTGNNPLGFTATALNRTKSDQFLSTAVRMINADSPQLLPYYSSSNGNSKTDIQFKLSSNHYSLRAMVGLSYQDVMKMATTQNNSREKTYRTFVKQTYLTIPESTKEAMLALAAQNGISSKSTSVIEDVQEYIQGAAKYNLEVGAFPAGVDTAVYFLTVAKEGYCQHFATAATMMYRALGIPARYTVGYMVKAEAGEYTDVLGANAHAWVEVYRDGIGWVQIEVTAGYGNSGSPTEIDGQEVLARYDDTLVIELTAASVEKYYDARPVDNDLSHLVYITKGALLKGHRIIAKVSGANPSIVDGGTRQINIIESVQIVDSTGQDVTEKYKIITQEGTLTILKRPITIRTGSASKKEDGTPLTESSWWITSGSIVPGQLLQIEITGKLKSVGTTDNSFICSISDVSTGRSVLANYAITRDLGILAINE